MLYPIRKKLHEEIVFLFFIRIIVVNAMYKYDLPKGMGHEKSKLTKFT